MSSQIEPGNSDLKKVAAVMAAMVLVLFVVSLTGRPLLSRHDVRVASYVLDAVQNGNWIVQKDSGGDIASKPPLLTWCAAAATVATGRISRLTLHLPSAAALCATALVLLAAGWKQFGWRAGFFAALTFIVSPAGAAQLATARYDGMLALMVALAAWAAFRAWTSGSSWTWFWLASAAGTMAKGPLAVVLGAAGLLAAVWEHRTGSPLRIRGNQAVGVLVFLVITGGWFGLAYGELGQPLIDKLIGRELIGHAVVSSEEFSPLGPLKPPIDFLLEYAPWSLPALFAFWRVWKQPDGEVANRRFERFLVCGFFAGMIVFCLAGHHKGRLILPLIPFAALLAGRELARFTQPWSNRKVFQAALALAILSGIGVFVSTHVLHRRSSRVEETQDAQQMSRLIRERLGADAPLTHVDSPFAVQFHLNRVRPTVSFERAAGLLRGNALARVVVADFARLEKEAGPGAATLHEVLRWPETGEPRIRVVGNRPLTPTHANQPAAMLLGPVLVEAESLQFGRLRLNYRRGTELNFRGEATEGRVRIANQGDSSQRVRLRIFGGVPAGGPTEAETNLAPGAAWSWPASPQGTK